MVYLTCAIIGLGGRGVIKTWTEVAARLRLYMLTSDLTSLVPPQFSHRLQVRKVVTVYLPLYVIYDRITIMGYSKHELSTINLLYSLKKLSNTALPPYNGHVSTMATFSCPQCGRCLEVRLY